VKCRGSLAFFKILVIAFRTLLPSSGVRAQLAAIVPLLVIQPWCVRGKWIRRRLIAEGTAVGTEGIVQAVRLEGASCPEGIGRGFRIERIRAQLAEIFRPSRSGTEEKQNQEPHVESPSLTLT